MTTWLLVTGLAASVLADCSQYMSNEDLTDYIQATAKLEPNLASVYSVGLIQNPVLVLSAGEPTDQLPNIKFIGGVHGDEPIGTQVLISFIEYLLDGYRREERYITWLLNNTRIHILTRLNPEGFELAIEGVCSVGPGRENGDGYDLNRSFLPSNQFKIQEVEAVMEWMSSTTFVLSAAVHAGEMVVVYPPDDTNDDGGEGKTTDDDVFKHLASVYAQNHNSMINGSGCRENKFKDGITTGAAWYPIKGSMQDYNYNAGTMELTLEISCCKYPPSDNICGIWEENKLALLKLVGESCRGVRGRVTSSGLNISGATLLILGRNMKIRTNDQGYYFRILLPGRYFIKVEFRGMKTFIEEFFVPQSETAFLEWAVVDIELEADISQFPNNRDVGSGNTTEQPTNHTISYDRGGLDPDTTATYDDLYLSSPKDSQVRTGQVTGVAARRALFNFHLLLICSLCKYFTTQY